MERNIVFYFTGTGNSLDVAKQIAEKIPNCEVVKISKGISYKLGEGYQRVGFVYPVYFGGLPIIVREFISKLDMSRSSSVYTFGVSTYGRFAGNGISQLKVLLKEKQMSLNYGKKLKMYPNYVVFYDMKKNVGEIAEKSNVVIETLKEDILYLQKNRVGSTYQLIEWFYHWQCQKFARRDRYYEISSNCISCGKCEKVCPVRNIEMKDGKPVFNNQCEHCLACLQWCPQKAINYGNKTQKRGRYTNPKIRIEEFF